MATYAVFFYDANGPVTGLTPTFTAAPLSQGAQASAPANCTEIDSYYAPGVYIFDYTPVERVAITVDGGASLIASDRYKFAVVGPNDFAITEGRLAVLDDIEAAVNAPTASSIADAVLDEALADHATPGSLGDAIRRTLGLRQENMRVVYTGWETDGKPNAGTVYLYPDKATLEAATTAADPTLGAIGTYAWSAAHDGQLRVTEYVSTREA